MSNWQYLAPLDDLPKGGKACLEISGVALIAVRIYSDVFVVRNHCPHLGKRMDEGRVQGHEIICPHHGACFDLTSGRPESGPALYPLDTFPTRQVDGEVYVLLHQVEDKPPWQVAE